MCTCVNISCSAGVTVRSAYRLRVHPLADAFVAAWDRALRVAAGNLTAVAFERAINGAPHEKWRNGELVHETRAPSDRMLMFLLKQFDRKKYGPYRTHDAHVDQAVHWAQETFPETLDDLVDLPGDPRALDPLPDHLR